MDNLSDEILIKEEVPLVTLEDSSDSDVFRSYRTTSPELNNFSIESNLMTKNIVDTTTKFVIFNSEKENSLEENLSESKDRADIVQTSPKGKGKGKGKTVVSSPTHNKPKIPVLRLQALLQRNKDSEVSQPRIVNDRENKVDNEEYKEKDTSLGRWVMTTRSREGVEGDEKTCNKTELPRRTSKTLQQIAETQTVKKAAKKKGSEDESSKSEDDEVVKDRKESKKVRVVKDSSDVDSVSSNEEIGDDAKNLNIWRKKKDRVQAGKLHDVDSEQHITNGRIYICKFCKKDFLTSRNLISHCKLKCPRCPNNVRLRMFGKKAMERVVKGARKKYICPQCSAPYKVLKCLRFHQKVYCGKYVTCPGCDKTLAMISWRNHMRTCARFEALPPSKRNKTPNVKEQDIHVSEDDNDSESLEE